MNEKALHDQLVELARAAGFELRQLSYPGSKDSELPATSGCCRLRGEVWVVLVATDSLEERTDVLARALKSHASGFLEDRYLQPAVRERLGC